MELACDGGLLWEINLDWGEAPRGLRECGWAVEVGRLFPTLAAADHAARDQRARMFFDPVADERKQRSTEQTVFYGHDPARSAAAVEFIRVLVQ